MCETREGARQTRACRCGQTPAARSFPYKLRLALAVRAPPPAAFGSRLFSRGISLMAHRILLSHKSGTARSACAPAVLVEQHGHNRRGFGSTLDASRPG